MFFTLAARLPAYQGVLAARMAAEERAKRPAGRQRSGGRPVSYDRGSGQENRASTASAAPPLTAGMAAVLNMQLGPGFVRHTVIKPAGGDDA